jgi:hypothetical protein
MDRLDVMMVSLGQVVRAQQLDVEAAKIPKPDATLYHDPWLILEKYGPIENKYTVPFALPDEQALKAGMMVCFNKSRSLEPPSQDEINKVYYNKWFGWWCPTRQSITEISELIKDFDNKVIDAGSGRGMTAKLLINAGVTVYAVDTENIPECFHGPERLSAEKAIAKYPVQTLLLAYPPYSSHEGADMAVNCVRKFKGKQLIYIGEPRSGCTANDEFFNELKSWTLYRKIALRRWSGMADAIYVYRKI